MNLRNLMSPVAIGLMLLISSAAFARSEVTPNCWAKDLPQADIIDGYFVVRAPTTQHSAQDVARLLNTTSLNTMGKQVAASSNLDGDEVQIELDTADLIKDWRPSGSYPTLKALKEAILESFQRIYEYRGATISCQKNMHPHPHPGGTVSN